MQTLKVLKLNGSKNLQNRGKFADEFFVYIVKNFFFEKTARIARKLPVSAPMAVKW